MAELPLLLPSFPNSVRVLTDRAFVAAGLGLKLIAETSAVSVLLPAASAGMGWTIPPWRALATEPAGAFAGVQIPDPSLARRLFLCVAAAAQLSLARRTVEDALLRLIVGSITKQFWQGVSLLSSLTGAAGAAMAGEAGLGGARQ